jgi:hypothetical protein
MTDCSEAEIRDQLPDLAAGNLSDADAAVVEAHVASCANCTEELALLRVVRMVRPQPVALNVTAIAARINEQLHSPEAHIVPVIASPPDNVRHIASARSARRSVRTLAWRWAAAVTLVAAGSLSVAIARSGRVEMVPGARIDTLLQADTPSAAPLPARVADTNGAARNATAISRSAAKTERSALSVGELSDYSDAELEGVLRKLDSWDGTASADPLLPVPLVKPSGDTP